MIKYTHEIPEEIDDLRLTDWCKKKSSFYPAQVQKVLKTDGKIKILAIRAKKPKIKYVKWMEQEKQRINNCGFAEKVYMLELLSARDEPMIALFPFNLKKKITKL